MMVFSTESIKNKLPTKLEELSKPRTAGLITSPNGRMHHNVKGIAVPQPQKT